jgi:FkbM family methyltransferase
MIQDLIYDVGLNKGNDTAYYLHRGFRVVAIEANPTLVSLARERFKREIAENRLVILNVGIAEKQGQLPFWVCETKSEWSSFDRRIASRDGSEHHAITIDCCRFESILEEYGVPYYLKVDIEGNDFLCLQDLQGRELPKYISIETSGISLLTTLHNLGYTSFKWISQINFLPLEIFPSDEQKYQEKLQRLLYSKRLPLRILRKLGLKRWLNSQINRNRYFNDWFFSYGSSGAFGEDLLGGWQSFDEIRNTYEHFQKLRKAGQPSLFWTNKGYSFWTDFHARKDG